MKRSSSVDAFVFISIIFQVGIAWRGVEDGAVTESESCSIFHKTDSTNASTFHPSFYCSRIQDPISAGDGDGCVCDAITESDPIPCVVGVFPEGADEMGVFKVRTGTIACRFRVGRISDHVT